MRRALLLSLTVLAGGTAMAATTAKSSGKSPSAAKDAAELAEFVRPSLVKITQLGREGADGIGSGFIVSADGFIATNLHVIGEARRLQIEMHDGKTHAVTAIHASDNHLDLALLKIDAKGLQPLRLGDSAKVRQGDPIVAMGAPEGLAFSIVQGVLSATREIDGQDMLQVAVPIEQGNSGGPMLDMQGRVLGILTLKSMKTDNLGFAMPVNELKKLIEAPNPVLMSRWLTIGVINPKLWKTHFGSQWTQHAGVIQSEFPGEGFGGRTLCLSTQTVPQDSFEITTTVRLDGESGAAGLTFCADGGDKHYGFYPSGGKLRLTRFDGPDIYSWTILANVPSDAYKPGDWNALRVRVEPARILCFVNGKQVIESHDTGLRGGAVGLCKFRATAANFRNFRIGTDLAEKPLQPEVVSKLRAKLEALITQASISDQTLDSLLDDPAAAHRMIIEQRRKFEEESTKLHVLDRELHRRAMTKEMLTELAKPESEINLLRCSLLLARHDNPEIEVGTYLNSFKAMTADLKDDPEIKKGTTSAVKRLNRYFFEENGFHGSRHDYGSRSNSYLNEVLDDREGLPITLSVLYVELAAALGVEGVFGVPLPGKFMVGYRDGPAGELQLIDVFERGTLMTVEQAALALTGSAEMADEFLHPSTKKAILERMLRNLLNLTYDSNGFPARESIPYLNLSIALNPQSSEHRFLRANLRTTLGEKAAAQEDVTHLIENLPKNAPPGFLQKLEEWHRTLSEK